MKTKTILLLTIALFLIGGMGCEKKEDSTITKLTGTRWELAGIMDVKMNQLKKLTPEGAYWFKFISETEG